MQCCQKQQHLVIYPALTHTNRSGKKYNNILSITQYNETAPQSMALKITIKLNQCLTETASAQAELYRLYKAWVYCSTVYCIRFNSF